MSKPWAGWRLSGNPVSDTYAKVDKLGFAPYVDAVCAFLTDRDTTPPLTMSVEGEWGSGKSSFMRQLQSGLEKPVRHPERWRPDQTLEEMARRNGPKPNARDQSRNLTFWFNAWRHDKQDEMWAAFALFLAKGLRERRTVFERVWGDLRLANSRAKTITAKIRLGLVMLLWCLLILATMGLVVYTLKLSGAQLRALVGKAVEMLPFAKAAKAGQDGAVVAWIRQYASAHRWAAALVVTGVAWSWVQRHLGKRLEVKLEKYLNKPDYDKRAAFIESFHEDFSNMVRAYGGNDKIFVFVDDLDRCDVPRAAELMQAINLMIGDNPIVFIVGMDREKVAAGITLKFKDLLPYLRSGQGDGEGVSARHPSAYGYTYLEKFIQISFRVPRTSPEGLEEFLGSLSTQGKETEGQREERRRERAQRSAQRQLVELATGADSMHVDELVRLVAPSLGWNPRRIKQFINTFRLQAYLASDLGLLDMVQTDSVYSGLLSARLTLEQIGLFVAVAMTWPDLVMDLVDDPKLLQGIYGTLDMVPQFPKDSRARWMVERWSGERSLLELLKETEAGPETKYSLRSADLRMLLNVFPREERRPPDAAQVAAATGPASAFPEYSQAENSEMWSALTQPEEGTRRESTEAPPSFESSFPGFGRRSKSPRESNDDAA